MTRRPWRSSGVETIGWLEFAGLLPHTGRQLVEHVVRIVPCWATWLLRHRRLDAGSSPPLPERPPTRWTEAVDNHLASIGMDKMWLAHSTRTWQFASALADQAPEPPDPEQVNPELLYIGAMLHDSGLFEPNPTRCFAVEGAAHAKLTADMADVHDDRVETVANAIASHISLEPGNVLGQYLQYGSLLDLAGTRLWKLDRDLVDRILLGDARDGLPADGRERWRAECERFPHGRAAYARCPGGFILATHLAPLPN